MSIQSYYGFQRLPFAKDIPPGDLFPAEGQQELCARLEYLTKERGLGLLTGETGCGKSTATLDTNRFWVIYLSNPLLGLTGLYRELLAAFGHEPPFSRPKMVARIRFVFDDLLTNKHRTSFLILTRPICCPILLLSSCACCSPRIWTANPSASCSSLAGPNSAALCAWPPMRRFTNA